MPPVSHCRRWDTALSVLECDDKQLTAVSERKYGPHGVTFTGMPLRVTGSMRGETIKRDSVGQAGKEDAAGNSENI